MGPPTSYSIADIGFEKALGDGRSDRLSQHHRDRVPELAHRFRPCSVEDVAVRKALDPCCLPYSEISARTVLPDEHVFAAGYAMISSLQCFRGRIERGASVTWIWPCTWLKSVVCDAGSISAIATGLWQCSQRVAHGSPCRGSTEIIPRAKVFDALGKAIWDSTARTTGNSMTVPVLPAHPLVV